MGFLNARYLENPLSLQRWTYEFPTMLHASTCELCVQQQKPIITELSAFLEVSQFSLPSNVLHIRLPLSSEDMGGG